MLQTVHREPNLTERAEQQLRALVLDGSFKPGDRLPSEGEMGRMLGVSRTVVREAVRKLVAVGLVEARNGSGIYIRPLDAALVAQPLGLLVRGRRLTAEQLIEVREAIEVEIAELAAKRAKADDIRALEETIETLQRKNVSRAEVIEADLAFNRRLAAATHNPLLEALSDAMNTVLRDFVENVVSELGGADARERTIRDHTRILDRVKARDPRGAQRAAQAELADARRLLGRLKKPQARAPAQ